MIPLSSHLRRGLRIAQRLRVGHPETWRRLRFETLNAPLMAYLRWLQKPRIHAGLVSVITPTCGRIETLNEAITSVDAQSSTDWEHLIICDGENPEVRTLARLNKEPRRRFFFTAPVRHFGNHQRNVGIARAKGEFLLFLDDDNVIYPEAIASMLAGFEQDNTQESEEPVGIVFAPIYYDHAKHGIHNQILMPDPDFKLGGVDSLNAMLQRSLAIRCNGWGDSYFADFDLLRLAADSARARYLQGPPIGHHR